MAWIGTFIFRLEIGCRVPSWTYCAKDSGWYSECETLVEGFGFRVFLDGRIRQTQRLLGLPMFSGYGNLVAEPVGDFRSPDAPQLRMEVRLAYVKANSAQEVAAALLKEAEEKSAQILQAASVSHGILWPTT